MPGVTVIIYDQRCAARGPAAAQARRCSTEPPRRVVINEAVCEGCGDCGVKSNCLSVLPVETEFGEKRQIHDPSCNRDYTCLDGDCPSFVTITPRHPAKRTAPEPVSTANPAVPPAPRGRHCPGRHAAGARRTGGRPPVRHLLHRDRRHRGRHREPDRRRRGRRRRFRDRRPRPDRACRRRRVRWCRTCTWPRAATTWRRPRPSAAGSADLYLSGDILQAAAARHLEKIRPRPDHRGHRPRRDAHRRHAAKRPGRPRRGEPGAGDRGADGRGPRRLRRRQAHRRERARRSSVRERDPARRGVPARRPAGDAR